MYLLAIYPLKIEYSFLSTCQDKTLKKDEDTDVAAGGVAAASTPSHAGEACGWCGGGTPRESGTLILLTKAP